MGRKPLPEEMEREIPGNLMVIYISSGQLEESEGGGGGARGVKGPFVFHTHAFFRPLAHWATFSLSMVFLLGNVTLTSGPVSRDGNPTQPPQATTHACERTRRTAKAAHLHAKPAPDGEPAPGSSDRRLSS